MFPADQQPPDSPAGGGAADGGLDGQEQQPEQRPNQAAAEAHKHRGLKTSGTLPAGEDLRRSEKQLRQQRQARGETGHRQGVGEQKAQNQRRQGSGGAEGAAQAVEELPALHGRKVTPFRENPGEILPVSPRPAFQAAVVGQRGTGKAVGTADAAEQAAPEKRALYGVMGEHPVFRHPAAHAGEIAVDVDEAFSVEAPPAPEVHGEVAAFAAIGVGSPGTGKEPGKVGLSRGGQLRVHPGGEDAVASGHQSPVRVDSGAVQRVQRRRDEGTGGARRQPGVAVQQILVVGQRAEGLSPRLRGREGHALFPKRLPLGGEGFFLFTC